MTAKGKVSLVLADVDGTLVTEDKVLTKRVQADMSALQYAGIYFAMPSGRPSLGMAMLLENLNLDTPLAGFNGGLFVTPELAVIERRTLPTEVAARSIELIHAHGLDPWVYRDNEWLIAQANAPPVARETWTVQFEPNGVPAVGAPPDRAVQSVAA